MYDEVKPDRAFICIPPYCHAEIEYESIDRGIAMFIEKPIALDIGLAKDIGDRIQKNNLIAASGFQCRYCSINEPAKEYIQKYPVVTVAASRVGSLPPAVWINRKNLSGGQLVEQTIHQMDMLRYLLGEAETVYSVPTRGFITASESPFFDTDDVSTTLITFKSGVTATMVTGWYAQGDAAWNSKMTFGGRATRMDYRLTSSVTVFGAKLDACGASDDYHGAANTGGKNEVSVYRNSNNFGSECDRTFIEAVMTGDPLKIRSPYADAVKSVAFVLACNESMASGQPVKVRI
jgi:predicted dehydrogenase